MELLDNLIIDFKYEVAVLPRHVDIENIKHFTENVMRLTNEYNRTAKNCYLLAPLELAVMLLELQQEEKNKSEPIIIYFYQNEKVAMYKVNYINWKIRFCEKLYLLTRLRDVTDNVFKSKLKFFVSASDILKVLRNPNCNWE